MSCILRALKVSDDSRAQTVPFFVRLLVTATARLIAWLVGRYWFLAIPSFLTMVFVYYQCLVIGSGMLLAAPLDGPNALCDKHRLAPKARLAWRPLPPRAPGPLAELGDLDVQDVNAVLFGGQSRVGTTTTTTTGAD